MFPISCNAFGDILAIAQLIRDIAAALDDARGAARDYQRLSYEMNMLSVIIEQAYQIALSSENNVLKLVLLGEVRRCAEDICEAGKLLPGYERLTRFETAGETSKLDRARTTVKKLQWHFLKASDAANFAKLFNSSQLRISSIVGLLHHYQLDALSNLSRQNRLSSHEEIGRSVSRIESSIQGCTSITTSAVYESSRQIRQDFSTLRQAIVSMTSNFTTVSTQRDNALVNRICDTFQSRLSSTARTSAAAVERQRFVGLLVPYALFSIAIVSEVTLGPKSRTTVLWATIIALIIHVLRQQSSVPTSIWSFSGNVIILIDALGDRIPVALQLCVSMEHFHQFLAHYYSTHRRHGADYVRRKAYELYGSHDAQVITPSNWEHYISPGTQIEMGILLRRKGSDHAAPVYCPYCNKEAFEDTSSMWYSCTGCTKTFKTTREASSVGSFDQVSTLRNASKISCSGLQNEDISADVPTPSQESSTPKSKSATVELGTPATEEGLEYEYREADVVQHFRRVHVIESVSLIRAKATSCLVDNITSVPYTRSILPDSSQTGPGILSAHDLHTPGLSDSSIPQLKPAQAATSAIAGATGQPDWLQKAIISGYRLDPNGERRRAIPPLALLGSNSDQSWTLDAQLADYVVDPVKLLIIPPRASRPKPFIAADHDDGYSTTPEAGSVLDLGLVATSNTRIAALSRSIHKRIIGNGLTAGMPHTTYTNGHSNAGENIALHWQLLPYNPKFGKPRMYYDIRFAPQSATHVSDHDGGPSPVSRRELEKPATKQNLKYMIFTTSNLLGTDNIEVHRHEGVRVCDVLERIYEHHQLLLTPIEKHVHRVQVERAHPYYEARVRPEHNRQLSRDRGMRRIDLMENKVVFTGCQWCRPSGEYPEGSWKLLFQPPPREVSAVPLTACAPVQPEAAHSDSGRE